MAESSIPLGPIDVFEEFICQAIPGPGVAGHIPEDAAPSRVSHGETVTQNESPSPHEASENGDATAFRSQLDKLPTAEILTLVQKSGLSAEQLRAVREVVAARQSEIQQLNQILENISPN